MLPGILSCLEGRNLVPPLRGGSTRPSSIAERDLSFPSDHDRHLRVLAEKRAKTIASLTCTIVENCNTLRPAIKRLEIKDLPVCINRPGRRNDRRSSCCVNSVGAARTRVLVPFVTRGRGNGGRLRFRVKCKLYFKRGRAGTVTVNVLSGYLRRPSGDFPDRGRRFILFRVSSMRSANFVSRLGVPRCMAFRSGLSDIEGAGAGTSRQRRIRTCRWHLWLYFL